MANRRSFLRAAMGFGASAVALPNLMHAATPPAPSRHGSTGKPVPVITPDVGDMPYTLDNGVKVFRLTAGPVKQLVAPGRTLDLWGFNGTAPGPTIQVTRGDRVRVIFENHLPEPTTMHWHGFEDLLQYDGVPSISQPAVKPGESFTYEFDIHQEGTFFYHSHMAMQEMAGMLGGFIMHPQQSLAPHVDRDFLIHLQEYWVLPNNTVPNTMNMEFNWLTINGKSAPSTTPLIVKQGERVRIRFVNMGMDHHPMHLHGNTFTITGTEAGRIQPSAWWPSNTVLVGVGQARDVEFEATRPGDWMLHCHLPHHMMNQMSSIVGPLSRDPRKALQKMAGMSGMDDMKDMPGMEAMHHDDNRPEIAPNANSVKNYPQDALMESSSMAMDSAVDKPENDGLPPGWSGFMGGMMSLVRVLPEPQFNTVMAKMRDAKRRNDPYASVLQGGL